MRSYSRYRSYSSLLTAHPMYSSIFWCRIYLSTDSSRSRYFSKSRPCRVCFFTATTSPKYFPMYTVEKAPSPTAGPIVTCNKTWVNRSRSSIYRAYEYDIRYLTWYVCRHIVPGIQVFLALHSKCLLLPQVTPSYQIKLRTPGAAVTVTSFSLRTAWAPTMRLHSRPPSLPHNQFKYDPPSVIPKLTCSCST